MTKRNSNRRNRSSLRNYTPILKEIKKDFILPASATSNTIVDLVTNGSDEVSNLTVKNFTTSLICEIPGADAGSITLDLVSYYVMFVPEGYTPAVNFPFIHPEWILNYSYVGTPLPDTTPVGFNIRRTSKRMRKLKPGDRIVLFILGSNNSSENYLQISGLIKYYSKRN